LVQLTVLAAETLRANIDEALMATRPKFSDWFSARAQQMRKLAPAFGGTALAGKGLQGGQIWPALE
jgi:hypothetical protein